VDAAEPECEPCATLQDCFGPGDVVVVDPDEEPPSAGCVSYFEASDAGGLQAVAVDEVRTGVPVQIRSGWYERTYHGERQRLYSDHGHASVIETDTGFAVAADHLNDLALETWHIAVDFEADGVIARPAAGDRGGAAPLWYALRRVGDVDVLFTGLLDADGERGLFRIHALPLAGVACASSAVISEHAGARGDPQPSAWRGDLTVRLGFWNASGTALERTEILSVTPARR
jgi:hypothetical protein